MVPKATVEARLKRAGAFWLCDADDQHEIWGTPWGFEVWVPIAGPLRGMYEEDLAEIEADIVGSRPRSPGAP